MKTIVKNIQKKILLLHCFPVPYRNHLFEALNKEATSRGIFFEVQFFTDYDESRPTWNFKSSELNFNHKFWKPDFKLGSIMHLNIKMLRYIYTEKPDLIILGGIWTSINTIFLSIFANFKLICWDETNRFDNQILKSLNTIKSETKILTEIDQYNFIPEPHINKRLLKRFLLRKINYFAIPGKESMNFYKDLFKNKQFSSKSFTYFPNLIDENLFNPYSVDESTLNSIRQELNIQYDLKIAYWPARFIPVKGILNFLNNIDHQHLIGWKIILVGHGPMESQIRYFVTKNKLDDYITMIDVLPYDKARLLYFISDLFILPSLSDSNPLSVIEAIHSSLPILVSNRIGNINEVLNNGINGICVDPFIPQSISTGFEIMFSKTKSELQTMGIISKELAIMNYSTQKVITDFYDDIQYKYKLI